MLSSPKSHSSSWKPLPTTVSKLVPAVFSSRVRFIRGVGVGRGPIELLLLLRIFPELRVVAKGKVYAFRVYEEDLNEIC
jgi:hypothetical protein